MANENIETLSTNAILGHRCSRRKSVRGTGGERVIRQAGAGSWVGFSPLGSRTCPSGALAPGGTPQAWRIASASGGIRRWYRKGPSAGSTHSATKSRTGSARAGSTESRGSHSSPTRSVTSQQKHRLRRVMSRPELYCSPPCRGPQTQTPPPARGLANESIETLSNSPNAGPSLVPRERVFRIVDNLGKSPVSWLPKACQAKFSSPHPPLRPGAAGWPLCPSCPPADASLGAPRA